MTHEMIHETTHKKAALTACSDPLSPRQAREMEAVAAVLREEGLEVRTDIGLFSQRDPAPAEKARFLNDCFRDPDMDFIFDVSGGDLANRILPSLDLQAVRASRALFFGYSDLTTVINAIIARCGRETVNYQIRNVLYDHAEEQRRYLREVILRGLLPEQFAEKLACTFLRGAAAGETSVRDVSAQGTSMRGRILGGNIRCFLKLAGTPYWPDMRGGILLLESYGGGLRQAETQLAQYAQMGVFSQVSGVLLGTFTKLEQDGQRERLEELVLEAVPAGLPVACTRRVGHGTDAGAVVLGRETEIRQS